jgi:hypothetical protein
LTHDNNNQEELQSYWEVDIEYVTQAKLVLLGKDEDDIRDVINNGLDIPDVKIVSVIPASDDLVNEAKARRAFEDAMENSQKNMVN